MARLACLLYWFNPLVWLAARRMCLERELACDDFLLCRGTSAERYANDLFEIAEAIQQRVRIAQLATPMATSSNLKLRIQYLMNPSLDRRSVSNRLSLITALIAVVMVTTLAAISPSIGIAQTKRTTRIADENDVAATLVGELPSDWFDQLNTMPKLRKLTIPKSIAQGFQSHAASSAQELNRGLGRGFVDRLTSG